MIRPHGIFWNAHKGMFFKLNLRLDAGLQLHSQQWKVLYFMVI